ncbi:Fe(3+) dicitrate ABC transporter ATP-binding protein FecE [Aliamphritea hakodatensis]|uniref:Fe(3+) dicitrate ABC transporter ATP-binding protein FecE n=1 Tax=Aliamphritea hakodatensis TaxID=2895352 RepID=UPI0022FD7697|nr:Fe(3+) dicitrate ABC transporter ATP-binding protein FecE [Aliamphritea hakodatensis]
MAYLSINNLSFTYGNRPVLQDLNLDIPQGKITALIGPNGCGKSTLLKCIARILQPQQGDITLQGDSVHRQDTRQLSQKMALLPQAPVTPEGISVKNLVGYGRAPWGNRWGRLSTGDKEIVAQALAETGLSDQAGQTVAELSGGQRQRAWIAMILAQQTDLVLLDEPTTWLDIAHQVELLQLMRKLNKQGKTVVVVLHDLNQACRYCDELVVLREGRLQAQGAPSEVFTRKLLEDTFSLSAEIHPDPVSGTPSLFAL